jgi:hypothetical protein
MQIDNPTLPLRVIYSILDSHPHPNDESNESGENAIGNGGKEWKVEIGKEEQKRRERTTSRLLSLVSPLASPLHLHLRRIIQ